MRSWLWSYRKRRPLPFPIAFNFVACSVHTFQQVQPLAVDKSQRSMDIPLACSNRVKRRCPRVSDYHRDPGSSVVSAGLIFQSLAMAFTSDTELGRLTIPINVPSGREVFSYVANMGLHVKHIDCSRQFQKHT